MPLRTRPEGYGLVAKALHWASVVALLAQVVVGYAMDWDDDSGGGRGRGRGRGGGSGRGRGRGGDEVGATLPDLGDDVLITIHLALGVVLLLLGVSRLVWRRVDSLPAWAEQLTEADKRWALWTERVLLGSLLVAPTTGIALLLSGDDDLTWLHVAAHLVLYAAVASHLALVLRRRLLGRMLPGAEVDRQERVHG